MKIILHVGPPKTGSSYIQEVLLANIDLLETMGWHLPEPGRPEARGDHRELAYQPEDFLTEGKQGRAELEALKERGCDLIFSAEGLCYWQPPQFEALADILAAERVDLVFFLRDPFATFYSTWREGVKHGNIKGLPEVFMEHFADPSHSVIINPTIILRKLAHLSKRFHLTVLPYDRLRESGENIVDHIWYKMMHFTAAYRIAKPKVNTSFPIGTSEFLRFLLQEYKAMDPTADLVAVRLAFHRLYNGSRNKKSGGILSLGGNRNYLQRLNEAMDQVQERKRTFTMQRDTGVHSFIRRQILEEFGKFVPEEVTIDDIYAQGDVEFVYFNTEDLWKSRDLRRLLRDIISAVQAELAAGAETRQFAHT